MNFNSFLVILSLFLSLYINVDSKKCNVGCNSCNFTQLNEDQGDGKMTPYAVSDPEKDNNGCLSYRIRYDNDSIVYCANTTGYGVLTDGSVVALGESIVITAIINVTCDSDGTWHSYDLYGNIVYGIVHAFGLQFDCIPVWNPP